jgi:hypothetical protein
MSDSAIHDAEREEWRCASYGLSEMERAAYEPDYRPTDNQPEQENPDE